MLESFKVSDIAATWDVKVLEITASSTATNYSTAGPPELLVRSALFPKQQITLWHLQVVVPYYQCQVFEHQPWRGRGPA